MLLRDRLRARLDEMGAQPDYPLLAREVLGIQNAPSDLARRLVSQALVLEDRAEKWQAIGERICRDAPEGPGVYVLRDAADRVLYVGKAINIRRRLRTHFSKRQWKGLKAAFARACKAEIVEVGSELEALLREAELIAQLQPVVNVQMQVPALATRSIPAALVRDVLVVLPSKDPESVELVATRIDGAWLLQRTRRDGSELVRHCPGILRFFKSPLRRGCDGPSLAPIVFSWLAHRGQRATRLDPHACRLPRVCARRWQRFCAMPISSPAASFWSRGSGRTLDRIPPWSSGFSRTFPLSLQLPSQPDLRTCLLLCSWGCCARADLSAGERLAIASL